MRKPVSASKMASMIRTQDGREYLYFGGSNYLGLNCDAAVLGALATGLSNWGFGAGASRSTSGETDAYLALESELCTLLNVSFAAVAPSTAVGSLTMMEILSRRVASVVADAALHPSLKAAIAASGLPCHSYCSADVGHAAEVLAAARASGDEVLLCTDGVNPVTGAIYPLGELQELATAQDSMLLVDDAHGFGILGDGLGSPAHCNLRLDSDRIEYIASFSKAVGAIGGVIASNQITHAERRNSVHFATSTPFPPFIAEGIRAAIRTGVLSPDRRRRVIDGARQLRSSLKDMGLDIVDTEMPLIAFSLGDPMRNEALYSALLDQGIWIPLIQYPSQSNESVFRLSVSALHTPAHLSQVAAVLGRLL